MKLEGKKMIRGKITMITDKKNKSNDNDKADDSKDKK